MKRTAPLLYKSGAVELMRDVSWLEDDLSTELSVERFTRTDTRGSVVVTDGVIQHSAAVWRGEVDAIEDVEHLGTKLDR